MKCKSATIFSYRTINRLHNDIENSYYWILTEHHIKPHATSAQGSTV